MNNIYKITVRAVGYETTSTTVEAKSRRSAEKKGFMQALRNWAQANDVDMETARGLTSWNTELWVNYRD